ncbi:hypothetical protein HR060_11065 [Catenovulum sp. SM1970]|uniref:hypothetical protein n=1 Tax=Marinifaba aquimaris TaxID=2741323 RepID=UPI001571B36B|nr:hypothetical protein [Marinifaba aquimaris]NTS77400.1 hypothetical protein [Marinifaba aquimaris]
MINKINRGSDSRFWPTDKVTSVKKTAASSKPNNQDQQPLSKLVEIIKDFDEGQDKNLLRKKVIHQIMHDELGSRLVNTAEFSNLFQQVEKQAKLYEDVVDMLINKVRKG